MATHLAAHFQKAGHEVTCIYSKTSTSAARLAGMLGTKGTHTAGDIPRNADFYLLCVPDSVVARISASFTGYQGIWLHCAGALPMDVMSGAHERFGVLYPLQTFSRDHPLSLADTPFLIEGSSEEVTAMIWQLAGSISRSVHPADTPSRLAIHLGAVFANNFTNHMVHVARQILDANAIDPQLIVPLLEETFHKLTTMKAADAQTGPALRDDHETMKRHLRMLKKYPEWEKLYTFISRDIRDTCRGKKEKNGSSHNSRK